MRIGVSSVIGIAFAIMLVGDGVFADETPRSAPSGMQVEVTTKELVKRPTSPMICGNFIESGFGRQVEGIWAEMFFNRSFEAIPPYTRAHYGSRGCGPDTDVEQQPWWHSGYEEPAWELAPGNPKADWSMAEHVSFWNGQRGGWLSNESTERSGRDSRSAASTCVRASVTPSRAACVRARISGTERRTISQSPRK